jgi:hypothetical protein
MTARRGGSISSDNTDDASMRSASPASVEPITDDREFFREENGRLFNDLSPIYFFPADDEEMDRLGKCGVWYADLAFNRHAASSAGRYPGIPIRARDGPSLDGH